MPNVHYPEDTQYFDESEPMEDWSESSPSAVLGADDVRAVLHEFRPSIQSLGVCLVAEPYDSVSLRKLDERIDNHESLTVDERAILKHFVRLYGRKQRKRPRDWLLRDVDVKDAVMDVRKTAAFLGYTWRRMRPEGYITHGWLNNASYGPTQ